MIKLIVLHSSFAVIVIHTSSIIIDMIFMFITFIIVLKLLLFARHFCFDFVRENERGEF